MTGPQAHWLADGKRLHLNHGPIDLIIQAFGDRDECRAAYAQAVARFKTILGELVEELPALRRPVEFRAAANMPQVLASTPTPDPSPQGGGGLARGSFPSSLRGGVRGGGDQVYTPHSLGTAYALTGPAARRMAAAVVPLAENFITPMAAVAGSVADEILEAMLAGRRIDRAYVNNGGDSALHLAPGQTMTITVAGTGHGLADRVVVRAGDPVRGVATSGWRGRSFSLGIADAVTILARTAAEADAAATIVANAVDLPGHPAIRRRPARELAPDSDLGDIPVTTDVGALTPADVDAALARGLAVAEDLRRRGLIVAAALFLGGESRVAGTLPLVGRVGAQRRGGGAHKPEVASPPPRFACSLREPLRDPPHKGEGVASAGALRPTRDGQAMLLDPSRLSGESRTSSEPDCSDDIDRGPHRRSKPDKEARTHA